MHIHIYHKNAVDPPRTVCITASCTLYFPLVSFPTIVIKIPRLLARNLHWRAKYPRAYQTGSDFSVLRRRSLDAAAAREYPVEYPVTNKTDIRAIHGKRRTVPRREQSFPGAGASSFAGNSTPPSPCFNRALSGLLSSFRRLGWICWANSSQSRSWGARAVRNVPIWVSQSCILS